MLCFISQDSVVAPRQMLGKSIPALHSEHDLGGGVTSTSSVELLKNVDSCFIDLKSITSLEPGAMFIVHS